MPRSSRPNKASAQSPDETAADIRLQRRHQSRLQECLEQVRKFHGQGLASLGRFPDRVGYGSMKAVVERGQKPEMLRKARQFANPDTGYSPGELDALVTRCEAKVYPLGISHVIRLLSIPKNGGQRKALEQKAIAGRWSRRRLDIEVRKVIGPQRAFAGRPCRKPENKDDALVMIAQVCRRWEGLMHVLMPDGKSELALPAVVVKRMRQADAVMRDLAREVEK